PHFQRRVGEHLRRVPGRCGGLVERGKIEGARSQGAFEAGPAGGRAFVVEEGGWSEEALLRHLPLEGAFRQVGVRLARVDAFGAPDRDPVLCHQLAFAGSTPRRIWSSSIDSNSALKFPSPKPSLPLRWMISKKIGPIMFSVNICSSSPCPSLGAPSTRMRSARRRCRLSPWPGTRASSCS